MVELLRHEVRFGELSFGPFIHYSTFFDLLIQATEELSYELGRPVEEIVAAGGVPYAPVAVDAEVERYPRYEDTIVVTGEPVSVGETNVQVDYRFRRASDGIEFGQATMVQVTITPEHAAEPVSPALRERLEALGSGERGPTRIDPRRVPDAAGDIPGFSRDVTFRTPHIEAAGLGYFEDYAREMSLCLEAALDAGGRSLRVLTGGTYPFVPVAWDFTIERSIAFEDEIEVVGGVLEADSEAVEVAYEFRRAATHEVSVRADLAYGCLDENGERVPFESDAIEAVPGG